MSQLCYLASSFNYKFSTRGSFCGRTQKSGKLLFKRLIEHFCKSQLNSLDVIAQDKDIILLGKFSWGNKNTSKLF